MITKYFDFGKKHVFSVAEEQYKTMIYAKCGIVINETHFTEGSTEDNIYIWITIPHGENTDLELLHQAIQNNGTGGSFDDVKISSNVDAIIKVLIDEYLRVFTIPHSSKPVRLYVYEFYDYALAWGIGRAIKDLGCQIERIYGIERKRVFCMYEPKITILCNTLPIYTRLINEKNTVQNLCYKIITKKFDYYKIIQKKDIAIDILYENNLSQENLNYYYRELF